VIVLQNTKLFRETPFNGYNREDVVNYITKQDQEARELEESYKRDLSVSAAELSSAKAEIEKLKSIIDTLNRTIEEKTESYNELNEEHNQLKNRLLEQSAALTEKSESAEKLQEKFENLSNRYDDLNKKVNNQEKLISELKTQNEEQSNSLREYIEKVCLLQAASDNDSTMKTKMAEYQRLLAEKDEKIKSLENNWDQCKRDYAVYIDVRNNVDKILNQAKAQADEIIRNADMKAGEIINEGKREKETITGKINEELNSILINATKESDRIIKNAKEHAENIINSAKLSTAETKEKLMQLKNSVSSIITGIDYAIINIDLDHKLTSSSDQKKKSDSKTTDEIMNEIINEVGEKNA
jgi:chromosome segregation ATPase